jgi:hypothetical protein
LNQQKKINGNGFIPPVADNFCFHPPTNGAPVFNNYNSYKPHHTHTISDQTSSLIRPNQNLEPTIPKTGIENAAYESTEWQKPKGYSSECKNSNMAAAQEISRKSAPTVRILF